MANVTAIQTIIDGPSNVVIKLTGLLDTSDVSLADLIDPAALSAMDNNTGRLSNKLRINKITYNTEDLLAVNLFWDATTDVSIGNFVGRGEMDFTKFGGLIDNSGSGRTGKILYSTTGWSGVLSFVVILECTKQYV